MMQYGVNEIRLLSPAMVKEVRWPRNGFFRNLPANLSACASVGSLHGSMTMETHGFCCPWPQPASPSWQIIHYRQSHRCDELTLHPHRYTYLSSQVSCLLDRIRPRPRNSPCPCPNPRIDSIQYRAMRPQTHTHIEA
jgi:hypothetical protein